MKKIIFLILIISFFFSTISYAENEIKKLSGTTISKGIDSTQYIEIYCIDGYKYIVAVSPYTIQVTQMTLAIQSVVIPIKCK
jgi:hypothetical protein